MLRKLKGCKAKAAKRVDIVESNGLCPTFSSLGEEKILDIGRLIGVISMRYFRVLTLSTYGFFQNILEGHV